MNDLLNVLRGGMPTGTEMHVGAVVSAIGTSLTYFIGWSDTLEALLVLMLIDYITGLLAAYINPNLKLDSSKGFRGICKKIMIILLIVLAHELVSWNLQENHDYPAHRPRTRAGEGDRNPCRPICCRVVLYRQ